jgi:hypothetical protein
MTPGSAGSRRSRRLSGCRPRKQGVIEGFLGRERVAAGTFHLGLDALQDTAQGGPILGRGVGRELPHGHALQDGGQLVELGGAGKRDRRHDRALVGDGHDESLGGELAQDLPNRGARHPGLLGELALDQPLAGLKPLMTMASRS